MNKSYKGAWLARHNLFGAIAIGLGLVIFPSCGTNKHASDQLTIDKACAFAQKMPKVELHVHLEGSIQPATLFTLARKNKMQLPAKNEEAWTQGLHFKDFNDFVRTYRLVESYLRTKKDYALIAYEFGKSCAQQNIQYAEVTVTLPTPQSKSPISWSKVLAGLNDGRHKAEKEFGISLRWVFDVVIGDNVKDAEAVYNFVRKNRRHGVVAFGLSSTKRDNVPASTYAYIFERARKDGVPRTIHAGENTSGRSISLHDALFVLHANRIGHGVLCAKNPQIKAVIRQCHIPLEICITSNIATGVFPSYAAHPIRQLWDEGVSITINSDDPGLFTTNLAQEYQRLVKQYHFSESELEQVSLNGVRSSFLSPKDKVRLEGKFKLEFARLRAPAPRQQHVAH